MGKDKAHSPVVRNWDDRILCLGPARSTDCTRTHFRGGSGGRYSGTAGRGVSPPWSASFRKSDQGEWKIEADAEPVETTDAQYRFEMAVPARKTIEFVVAEKCTEDQQVDLKTVELQVLEGLTRRTDLPEDVLDIIKQVRQLRVGIADLASKLKLHKQLLADITNEQSRIRHNMSSLTHEKNMYRRYVAKLTKQEDNFDKGREVIWQARVKLAEMRRELAKYFPSSKDDSDGVSPFDPFGIGPPEVDADPFGDTAGLRRGQTRDSGFRPNFSPWTRPPRPAATPTPGMSPRS